jgi:hypothetical protein
MDSRTDSRPPTDLRAGIVGCLTFAGSLFLGLVVTVATTRLAVRDEPREEAYQAIGHDFDALFWWGMGGVASLALATVIAIVCSSGVSRKPSDG